MPRSWQPVGPRCKTNTDQHCHLFTPHGKQGAISGSMAGKLIVYQEGGHRGEQVPYTRLPGIRNVCPQEDEWKICTSSDLLCDSSSAHAKATPSAAHV